MYICKYVNIYIYIYTWVFSRDTMRRQEVPMSFHFKNDHASSWLPSTSGSQVPEPPGRAREGPGRE